MKLFENNKKWTHAYNAFLSCGIAKKVGWVHFFDFFFSQNDNNKNLLKCYFYSFTQGWFSSVNSDNIMNMAIESCVIGHMTYCYFKIYSKTSCWYATYNKQCSPAGLHGSPITEQCSHLTQYKHPHHWSCLLWPCSVLFGRNYLCLPGRFITTLMD